MNTKYTRVYTVGCGDMDVNYRLTKIAAAKFFQETFAMNCARHNLAAFDVCKQNLVWVISDLHIEFSSTMPYWSEEFSVEIWISEKTKMRTYCDFQIYYKNNVIAKVIAAGICSIWTHEDPLSLMKFSVYLMRMMKKFLGVIKNIFINLKAPEFPKKNTKLP